MWEIAAAAAVIIFAAGAPFSIVLGEIGASLAILLAICRPTLALAPLRRNPLLGTALLFYVGIQFLVGLFAEDSRHSLAALRGEWHLLFLPAFLAMLTVPNVRRWALPVFLTAASLAGLTGAIQHFASIDPWGRTALEPYGPIRSIAVGTFSGHLTYAGVLMVAFAAALGSWDGRRARLLWLPLLLIGGGLLGSLARSAWIGAAAGVIVWVIVSALQNGQWGRRRLIWAPLLLLAAFGVILLLPGVRERFSSIAHLGEMPRMRLWETAGRIFAAHPLFGAGLGSFQEQFEIFRIPGDYLSTCHPHNDFMNVLASTGLAGALAWLGLWGALLWSIGRRACAPMLWGVLATFLVAGLGQCYFTDEEPVAVLWFVLALALTGPGSPEAHRDPLGRRLERHAKRALLPLAARILPPRNGAATPLECARRILLVRQDNRLGNMLLITPFLQALRELAPEAHICAHTGDRFTEVFQDAPWIDELIIERKRYLIQHPWAYPGHLRRLRRGQWDLVFELSNPDTHSFYNTLLTLVAGAPARIGFDHVRSRPALSCPVARPSEECHASLAPLLLLSALGAEPPIQPMRLPPHLTAGAGERILFHPGGRGSKRWPSQHSRALIEALPAPVRRRLMLIGGPAEQSLLAELSAAAPEVAVKRLGTLADLIGVLQETALYVGCDAGPLHVVAALEIPTLALFRTSHPLRYAPLGDRHETLLLGAESRHRATATRFTARAEHPDAVPWDPDFAAQLAARRPRMVSPPSDLDPAAEVAFVAQRLMHALERIATR